MRAVDDSSISQIILYIDSPGGTVAGAFEAADQVAAACKVKPVFAVVGGMACSAAYLLAAAANEIIVAETSVIGSVGVVAMHIDQTEALAQAGVKITEVFAGGKKVDLSPFRTLSDQAKTDLQVRIDPVHELFVQRVATWRGISANAVRGTEAGVFMGRTAISRELADRIGAVANLLTPASINFSMEDEVPRQMLHRGFPLSEAQPKVSEERINQASFRMGEALFARSPGCGSTVIPNCWKWKTSKR